MAKLDFDIKKVDSRSGVIPEPTVIVRMRESKC